MDSGVVSGVDSEGGGSTIVDGSGVDVGVDSGGGFWSRFYSGFWRVDYCS